MLEKPTSWAASPLVPNVGSRAPRLFTGAGGGGGGGGGGDGGDGGEGGGIATVTPAVVETDILGPSEAFRRAVDYYSYTRDARAHLGKLAALAPRRLACMHGSAWVGDGAKLLGALADALAG